MPDLSIRLAGNRAIIEPRTEAGHAFTESKLAPFRYSNGVVAVSPGKQEHRLVELMEESGVTYSVGRVI